MSVAIKQWQQLYSLSSVDSVPSNPLRCSVTFSSRAPFPHHPHFSCFPIPPPSLSFRTALSTRTRRFIRSVHNKRLKSRMSDSGKEQTTVDPIPKRMVFQPILEDGVFRFDCSEDLRELALPSLSFSDASAREKAVTTEKLPEYTPSFLCVQDMQIVTFEFPSGSSFYGTGEVGGPLERTGKRVFSWNTDAWGYGSGTPSLYQSHPWVLVLLPGGEALGVLADSTRRCEIDLRKESTIKFIASSVYPVVTFGPFRSPVEVLTCLSRAIGTCFMPPKWSLGYHQCRWSYYSAAKVLEVATTFRERGIPCDVIWMDIDYMDGFRCFTFDKERFPNPKSIVEELHAIGMNAIWMLDPGIKHEEGYSVYDSGCKNDVWVLQADGKPFIGEVWPGPCVFPDYTKKRTRSWWAKLVQNFTSNGVDGIWNDMNEPAVFKVVTKTMPESNIHRGDSEFGGLQNHLHYHNAYGMLMARSTYEGMQLADEKRRPFVLTRAGFIGSQRYAATWTGDNLSNWEHLHMSIPMVLSLGLSGQPFSGPDIGGFAGNATPKLFGRWMAVGAMLPFCRGHTETQTIDHEPWAFGAECEEVCRLALMRRYRLIPYIYTLFYLAHMTGSPVVTPIFFAGTKDISLRKVENEFLLGSILVCASTVPSKGSHELQHLLPSGVWSRFDFGDSHPDLPTLYLQGGSIVPVGPSIQFTGQAKITDDVTLIVALDESGKAKGMFFEDSGDGYDFLDGGYLLSYYEAQLKSSVVTVKVSETKGSWRRPTRALHVELLLGSGAKVEASGTDGEELQFSIPSPAKVSSLLSENEQQYQAAIENCKGILDDQNLPGSKGSELSKTSVELRSGDWVLQLVPWIGGRIISMFHAPSGTQWLHSRVEINGYEEYSGSEYRSAGCSEEYDVIQRDLEQSGEDESICLRGDIGGGLVLQRQISIPKNNPEVFRIESGIMAENVGAGSGGFSRLVCLRVHPTFTLFHPAKAFVAYTSVEGVTHEVHTDMDDQFLEGDARPNGEWMLVDEAEGLMLVSRFNIEEVSKCLIHWGTGTCNLELWSVERPVSKDTPLTVSHEYEVMSI